MKSQESRRPGQITRTSGGRKFFCSVAQDYGDGDESGGDDVGAYVLGCSRMCADKKIQRGSPRSRCEIKE